MRTRFGASWVDVGLVISVRTDEWAVGHALDATHVRRYRLTDRD